MDGSLTDAQPETLASPSKSVCTQEEEAPPNPPSSSRARDANAGNAVAGRGGATLAETVPAEALSPEIQSFLRAFVARAVAESPQAARAARGRKLYYPDIPDSQWYDWKWQNRNRVTTLDELYEKIPFPKGEWAVRREVLRDFRMGVTPYYLTLMDRDDPEDPLARQVLPLADEYEHRASGDEDPLAEENFSPVPGITHRYPDRCLMVVSNFCAIYCRYCTRKRIMYEDAVPELEVQAMVDYIARTPSIRDVVVSGGDPLTFSTDKLERILSKLRAIPHLEIIRIGSRVPVANPMRVTDELCEMLQKYHPLWINVHYNHVNEITPDAARACDKLIRAGIPLNNQAVLLRGVNDSVPAVRDLVHGLMKMRVRPYYLYICDPVRGANHFRTTVAKGIEIMEGLRGHTSGLAIPQFVVDAPQGGGKIPVNPQYLLAYDNGRAILRNFQGKVFEYQDPVERAGGSMPAARLANEARGVAALARNGFVRGDAGNGNGNGNGNGHGHGNGNGHGHGHGNGNGNGNGHGCGEGSFAKTLAALAGKEPAVLPIVQQDKGCGANGNAGDASGAPVVGKSAWVHRKDGPPRS